MSTPAPLSDNRTIAAAILLVVLVGIGLSLLNPLLSVALERQGVSALLSGLSASAAGVGTIAVVALLPRLIRVMGLVGLLGAAIVTSALATLAFPALPGLAAWTLLRFLMGAAIGVIFTLSEYWINAAAPPARRGMVMGLYATALYAGFALGPLLLGLLMKPEAQAISPLPFLVTAGLMALGLIPLFMARSSTPSLRQHGSSSPWRFIRAAPAATIGAFVFGVVETGAILLLPVHGLRLGLDPREATWLVAAFTLGNVALQIPVGLLSDRVARLPLMATLALVSAGALLALVATPPLMVGAALLFIAGGISGGIYPVALVMIGERFSDADLAAANGAVVALYSLGLILGPPVIGLMMDALGASGLPLALGTVLLLFGGLILITPKKATSEP
jgi:MFS family permease